MVFLENLKSELEGCRPVIDELKDVYDIEHSKERLEELREKAAEPGFWDDLENSQKVLKETPDFATFPTKNPPQPLKIRAFRGFGGIIFCSGIKLSEHFDFAFNFQHVTSSVKFSWDFYSVGI